MKTLLLNRHAKSSWSDDSITDIQRPLNHRGKEDAPMMGDRLKKRNIAIDKIISSPAVRAFTTANIIAAHIHYAEQQIEIDERIYMLDCNGIISIIKSFSDELNSVLVFGHNPDFTIVANTLANIRLDNLPTCGIVAIEFNTDHWQDIDRDNSKLLFCDYPKLG